MSASDFFIGVSNGQLGAIYRAFKDGKFDTITQREISAMYDAFKGVERFPDGSLIFGWSDSVSRLKRAAKASIGGDYEEAERLVKEVVENYVGLPNAEDQLHDLKIAIKSGAIKVKKLSTGYELTGATFDYKDAIKANYGAKWDAGNKAWIVSGNHADFDELAQTSEKVAVDRGKRAVKASKDGAKELDKQRAIRQKKMADDIEDVYKLALAEHKAELDAIKALQDLVPYDQDPAEFMKLLNRRKELDSMIDGLAAGLADAGRAAEALTSNRLIEAAAISRDVAAWQIDNMAGMHVSRFIAHDTASLAAHSKYDKISWRGVGNVDAAKKHVKQSIARGLLTGEHPGVIAKRLEGLFDGQTPGSAYKRAVRIAQTETNRVMSAASQEFIRATNDSGIKCRNRWDATLDSHTRKSHRKVDGEIVEVGEKFSNGARRPGDGGARESINCRCCLTPVLDGFEPDAPVRRDNITGETIPYQTYKQWAKANGTAI